MTTAMFIRSYWKDAPWLALCLRSLRQFAFGFSYTMVSTPTRDHDVFAPLQAEYGFRWHEFDEVPGKGMLHGEIQLCRADIICPDVDAVCLLDSDCIATAPMTPSDYTHLGLPVLLAESFASLRADVTNPSSQARWNYWHTAVVNALGFDPSHETMCRHPVIHWRELFAPFRAAVEAHTRKAFDDYVLSCRNEYPQTFAELPALGAWAMRTMPERYYVADVRTDDVGVTADSGVPLLHQKLKTYWSHGGLTPEYRAEIEAILQ